jgi:hypothetical protein
MKNAKRKRLALKASDANSFDELICVCCDGGEVVGAHGA